MRRAVFVVEDDPASSELLQLWLQAEGYEVRCAADISASRAAIGETVPDLILLDIGLGAEDGLQLAAWIRQQPQTAAIPVIAVTAHAMVSDRARIFASGCNAFLAKPVDFEELRQALRDWLNHGKEIAPEANHRESSSERGKRADQSVRSG